MYTPTDTRLQRRQLTTNSKLIIVIFYCVPPKPYKYNCETILPSGSQTVSRTVWILNMNVCHNERDPYTNNTHTYTAKANHQQFNRNLDFDCVYLFVFKKLYACVPISKSDHNLVHQKQKKRDEIIIGKRTFIRSNILSLYVCVRL